MLHKAIAARAPQSLAGMGPSRRSVRLEETAPSKKRSRAANCTPRMVKDQLLHIMLRWGTWCRKSSLRNTVMMWTTSHTSHIRCPWTLSWSWPPGGPCHCGFGGLLEVAAHDVMEKLPSKGIIASSKLVRCRRAGAFTKQVGQRPPPADQGTQGRQTEKAALGLIDPIAHSVCYSSPGSGATRAPNSVETGSFSSSSISSISVSIAWWRATSARAAARFSSSFVAILPGWIVWTGPFGVRLDTESGRRHLRARARSGRHSGSVGGGRGLGSLMACPSVPL